MHTTFAGDLNRCHHCNSSSYFETLRNEFKEGSSHKRVAAGDQTPDSTLNVPTLYHNDPQGPNGV